MGPVDQCRKWEKLYRNRKHDTFLTSKSLTSLRKQHTELVDLQSEKRDVRWNTDYDMKRRLVNVRDVDGLITADTLPWMTIDDFEKHRTALDDWKKAKNRVLKTKLDYADMTAWSEARETRKAAGTSPRSSLPSIASAIVRVMAHGRFGSDKMLANEMIFGNSERPTLYRNAVFLIKVLSGFSINETSLKNAKRRCRCPGGLAGSIVHLTEQDREFLTSWFAAHKVLPEVIDIVLALCADGSAAECDLYPIFCDALALADPSEPDCDPNNSAPGAPNAAQQGSDYGQADAPDEASVSAPQPAETVRI